ncbi:hypothetical protein FIBSPDRAFT_1044300 [Athelia psychrophila]|uniref:Uncharacterized protein n=1 Tax=Athelia psychrophila TaxID=1759441 RepID=A0A166JR65_9AGAM|nr:hypothetical protein FIBSPDRAFT_1044300 [Fibularhizoctonia sp. CBS 109695]
MLIATLPANLTLSQIPSNMISREGGLQVILALLVLALGFLARSLLHAHQTRVSPPEEEREMQKALEALLAVLNPPNSRWPFSYVALARAAARSGSRTIRIPLVELVQDLLNGIVELRDASALGELIAGRRVYGWRFILCAGERERRWMKQAQKSRAKTWDEVVLKSKVMRAPDSSNGSDSFAPCEPHPAFKTCATPTLLLTGLSLCTIAHLMRLEELALPSGGRLTLEINIRASTPRRARHSDDLLCAIPSLLYSCSTDNEDEDKLKYNLNGALDSEAMDLTLTHLLALLPPLVIESVQNVSQRRMAELQGDIAALDRSQMLRDREWRKRKLQRHWEEGLLGAGKMEAWVVVVKKA